MRPDLPAAPTAVQALPLDGRGYPVPWFVHVDEHGESDFRIIGYNKIGLAVRDNLCWICGKRLRRIRAFVIGPMCVVNRVSAEPPSHPECADFAAHACPFLTHPLAKRNERDLPDATREPPGVMLARNPGVTCVLWAFNFKPFNADNGTLFRIGRPIKVQWFARGRHATRAEVIESIDSGMPFLRQLAEAEGPEAEAELAASYKEAMRFLPRPAADQGEGVTHGDTCVEV